MGRSLSKSLAIPCKEWIRAGRVTAPPLLKNDEMQG